MHWVGQAWTILGYVEGQAEATLNSAEGQNIINGQHQVRAQKAASDQCIHCLALLGIHWQ